MGRCYPKAGIEAVLKYRSLKPGQAHKLPVIQQEVKQASKSSHQLAFEVASIEALDKEDIKINNNLDQMPEGDYKNLLRKYPGLLELDFKTEMPKNKIIHRIRTGEADPCRAKVRRYQPGSVKAVKAKQAVEELVKLRQNHMIMVTKYIINVANRHKNKRLSGVAFGSFIRSKNSSQERTLNGLLMPKWRKCQE